MNRLQNTIGFDDGPFMPSYRGDVDVIGAVFSGLRLDGVLRTRVRRDGRNATNRMVDVIERSRFRRHPQLILLQGIAVAGFNVVDIGALSERLSVPVAVISRREPDLSAVREALLGTVRGGRYKWRLIERAGQPTNVGGLWVQCAGCTIAVAESALSYLAVNSRVPEPLRTAHLIAGGICSLATAQRV